MAETPKITKEQLLAHLAKVSQESVDNQAGKIGCNPYLWIKNTVNPLTVAVSEAKEVSGELSNKVLSLKALAKPAEPKK